MNDLQLIDPNLVSSALYSYTDACFNFYFHGGLQCALHEEMLQNGGYKFQKRGNYFHSVT